MGRADIANNVGLATLHAKIERNANATIQGTDVSEFHGAAFVVDAGAYTSGGGFDVKFQHRDSASDSWADIPDAELYGADNDLEIREADANTQTYVGYAGSKRFIGAVLTRDTTGIMVLGVSVVKGHPTHIPPTNR
jgi:hypothetical protein